MKTFWQHLQNELVYIPALGIGHYPVAEPSRPYDEAYFVRYQRMADTAMGRALTAARMALVSRHWQGDLLDVGIGAGQFVATRPGTLGYDVNPCGIRWLEQQGRWADLYAQRWPALSFWDALEHIDKPDLAVMQAAEWVFVSIPIFSDGDAILRSHHFRPDEHIYYFTHHGLINWFSEQGFCCREHNSMETRLGRSGIGSYAFQRRSPLSNENREGDRNETDAGD